MIKTKAPSDEGAVDCKLTERQFTFYKSTEGGKNYKLDELIGYYLIYLHYIINPTNPNLSNPPYSTIKTKKTKDNHPRKELGWLREWYK